MSDRLERMRDIVDLLVGGCASDDCEAVSSSLDVYAWQLRSTTSWSTVIVFVDDGRRFATTSGPHGCCGSEHLRLSALCLPLFFELLLEAVRRTLDPLPAQFVCRSSVT